MTTILKPNLSLLQIKGKHLWSLVQEQKGIVVEQPSILSSLRSPMPTAMLDPVSLEGAGGAQGTPFSPSEERSPDAVSSASEATEAGERNPLICYLVTIDFLPSDCIMITPYSRQHGLFVCTSPQPPDGSLGYRELFCSSAQRVRQQQPVFLRPKWLSPLPAGSPEARGHRQPVPGQH